MIPELLAAAITLLAGPLAFYLFTFKYRGKPSFPVGEMDKYGDFILLPLFNALAVHYGILAALPSDLVKLLIALTVSYVLTRVFVIWRKDFAKHNDWTRPERGTFNAAGWYHAVFIFAQGFFMAITLLWFYSVAWLWLPVAGFVLLAALRARSLSAGTP